MPKQVAKQKFERIKDFRRGKADRNLGAPRINRIKPLANRFVYRYSFKIE